MSDLKHTQRGFAYIEFQDRYDHKCSIQKSSLATEDAIWFGIDDANPQIMHVDARRLGIETDATNGWVPYPLPSEVSLSTRMHLTQDQVRELLPTLIHFAETGDVLAPADCRTQPEAAPAPEPEFICEITEGTVRINPYGDKPIISGKRTYTVNIPAAEDLSAAIMNIRCEVAPALSKGEAYQYKLGHRDARHAAAELANEAALASPADALVAGDSETVKDAELYREIRKWNPKQFTDAWARALSDKIKFDELVNAAIQAQKDGHAE